MKTIKVNCPTCLKDFDKSKKEYDRQKRKNENYKCYCSVECSHLGNTRKDNKYSCLECKQEFVSKSKDRKFCSHSCRAFYHNRNRVVSLETKRKISIGVLRNKNSKYILFPSCKIYYRECKNCNKLFITKNNNKKYCSNYCIGKSKTNSNKTDLQIYRTLAKFKFNIFHYPDIFDLSLVKRYGLYKAKNRGDNLNGVSRDHIFSVKRGFELCILPKYLAHPANCQLLRQSDNSSKNSKCDITIKELFQRIENWNNYGAIV